MDRRCTMYALLYRARRVCGSEVEVIDNNEREGEGERDVACRNQDWPPVETGPATMVTTE